MKNKFSIEQETERPEEKPTPQEIGAHIAAFKAELDWFYARDIRIHLEPKPDGWSLKFSIPE